MRNLIFITLFCIFGIAYAQNLQQQADGDKVYDSISGKEYSITQISQEAGECNKFFSDNNINQIQSGNYTNYQSPDQIANKAVDQYVASQAVLASPSMGINTQGTNWPNGA